MNMIYPHFHTIKSILNMNNSSYDEKIDIYFHTIKSILNTNLLSKQMLLQCIFPYY